MLPPLSASWVWRVVHVSSVAAEDQRHLHQDVETVKQERASTTGRIKSLLSRQGIRLASLSKFSDQLEALRLWDGSPIPSGLRRRVLRVYAHHEFLSAQMAEVEAEPREMLRTAQDASIEKVCHLMHLRSIGITGAWLTAP